MEEFKIGEIDDLLEDLGVEIPTPERRRAKLVECGQEPPAVRRHTEWSNAASFESVGYIAKITQTTCENCGSMRENFIGVFHVEVKKATGARRMQALQKGAQIPQAGEGTRHTCEVGQAFTAWCPDCIGDLGFKNYVEAEDTPFDIRIP